MSVSKLKIKVYVIKLRLLLSLSFIMNQFNPFSIHSYAILQKKEILEKDLREMFQKYGRILDVIIKKHVFDADVSFLLLLLFTL